MASLNDKQKDRLETAHEFYKAEYNSEEMPNITQKSGGQEYLREYYKQAIAIGMADRITDRREKNKAELQTEIGIPEDYK